MNKFITMLMIALTCTSYGSDVWRMAVNTNQTIIAPGTPLVNKRLTVGPVVNGDVYSCTGRVYFVVTSGSVTNLPSHSGQSSESGTVLRAYAFGHNSRVRGREVIYVENTGDTSVFVADTPIAAGEGLRLDPGDRAFIPVRGSLRARTSAGSTMISAWEVK